MAQFSWTTWHWHPDIITALFLVGGLYLIGVGPLRKKYRWAIRVPKYKLVLFFSGLAFLYIALNSPLHELSDNFLFSAHMVQHIILMILVPPLLILGIPTWLFQPILRPVFFTKIAKFILSPVVAFLLFSSVFSVWHFPPFYDATLRYHYLHVLEHLLFISAATVMWWPILVDLPEIPRPSYPVQMGYLFFLSLPPGFIGAAITFSKEVKYTWYEEMPRIWGISPLLDQQIGGLIMKLFGAASFLIVLGVVFFIWYKREYPAVFSDKEDFTA